MVEKVVIGKLVVEEGKAIQVEREIYKIEYDCLNKLISFYVCYNICGEDTLSGIKRKLEEVLGISLKNLTNLFNTKYDLSFISYPMTIHISDLDKLPDMLKKCDEEILDTLRELIAIVCKIKMSFSKIV